MLAVLWAKLNRGILSPERNRWQLLLSRISDHTYILGRRFTLRTDHVPLTWLVRFKESEGQLACWLEKLQQVWLEILHFLRKRHKNADVLSWLPCLHCGQESHAQPEVDHLQAVADTITNSQTAPLQEKLKEELRHLQLEDTSIGFVKRLDVAGCTSYSY